MVINHRYLWDTEYLKSLLANRTLTEGKVFAYFFTIMVFDWLQFTAGQLMPIPKALSAWERVDIVLTFLLTILGLLFVFWCNGGKQGKDFLYRYFPLSFVVGWKFIISAAAVLWATGFLLQNFPELMTGWVSTTLLALFNIVMFLRIGFHMKELTLRSVG